MRDGTHVYSWENEPVDERPSDFMSTTGYSTGYSLHSGFYTPSELSQRAARRRRGTGLGKVAAVAVGLLALSAWAMHALLGLLRH